ncbi:MULTISPECIES: hypothetical protein [Aneurinibacillus]|jgi:hypothetical protein|uniref:DUF2007 domain-containing protein n=1 Tax=Aneurinibacillus danicus TaxID=267746 RepID=A0A511V923_9BACL|nr:MULTISPECIES: hypothetical protein [Aneurinibacillus]GEN34093.1 hypothetical protein ADA01nite_15530 [Aneurinibacillus danicus]
MDWDFPLVLTIVVLGVIIVLPAISSLKEREYRCLVYTAFNNNDYFKATSRLRAAGIKYDIKIRLNSGYPSPSGYSTSHDYTQYDIYVKKEEEHKAQRAIHDLH